MAISSNLGFPRIGRRRELKQLLEAYWAGEMDAHGLESGARALRLAHWRFQAGIRALSLPNGIGPGVYDIHSPRVPSREEIVALLERALQHIPAAQLWVNPDCGLKTRTWDEVIPALRAMVEAAQAVRTRVDG